MDKWSFYIKKSFNIREWPKGFCHPICAVPSFNLQSKLSLMNNPNPNVDSTNLLEYWKIYFHEKKKTFHRLPSPWSLGATLKSRTDSCSMTGTGTAAGSAGMGGAKVDDVEDDLLNEANNKGDRELINNCSLVTGSLEPWSSRMFLPVVEVDLMESPWRSLVTRLPYIRYSSAVRGRASLDIRVTLMGDGPGWGRLALTAWTADPG